MDLTVYIPGDIASRISASRHLSRRALEEYSCGHLTGPELRRLLSFETRNQLDGFLNSHGIYADYTLDDLEGELEGLSRLGI